MTEKREPFPESQLCRKKDETSPKDAHQPSPLSTLSRFFYVFLVAEVSLSSFVLKNDSFQTTNGYNRATFISIVVGKEKNELRRYIGVDITTLLEQFPSHVLFN